MAGNFFFVKIYESQQKDKLKNFAITILFEFHLYNQYVIVQIQNQIPKWRS